MSNPGPTANSGNTKHPAPTVFPVINMAQDRMGNAVVLHHEDVDIDSFSSAALTVDGQPVLYDGSRRRSVEDISISVTVLV